MSLLFRLAAPAALLVFAGGAATAGFASGSPSQSIRCGIETTTQHGMMNIVGTVLSPDAINGEYSFALDARSGGGSSQISQGGAFAAPAGTAVNIGQVSLNAGTRFNADFTLKVDGKSIDCSDELTAARR